MAKSLDLAALRAAAASGRVQWHQHALERLLERGISRQDVLTAVMQGEIVEVYADDRPYPGCLLLHIGAEPLHVVAAVDETARICHVITAYRPDRDHFEADFKTRRKTR